MDVVLVQSVTMAAEMLLRGQLAMEFCGTTLDDVLYGLYRSILDGGQPNTSRRGVSMELLGVAIRLREPRARVSRSEDRGKLFSALGELLWYVAGSDDLRFIKPYIPRYAEEAKEGKIGSAYGPRLFRMRGELNQLSNVAALLKRRPGTRRAVIQLFNAEDVASDEQDIPCTTTLQFLLRDGRLHLSVAMRSNDAYWGFPHDLFCFTMLQEMMGRYLDVDLGDFIQYVGSMHTYENMCDRVERYLSEGHQQVTMMPPMPSGPCDAVGRLLAVEKEIRRGHLLSASDVMEESYWADIVRLLQAFWATGDAARITRLVDELACPMYKPFVESREKGKRPS